MKKYVLFVFIVISSNLSGQSIYPLSFNFDDKNYYISHILHKEGKTYTFGLKDTEDNSIYVRDNIMLMPKCNTPETLEEILKYTQESTEKCQNFFQISHSKIIDKIDNGDLFILIFQNAQLDEEQIAIIFDEKKIIGEIGFISSDSSFEKFYKLLKSLKNNRDVKTIEHYQNNLSKHLKEWHVNLALKNFVALQILLKNNKQLEESFQKILKIQRTRIKMNELDFTNKDWGQSPS